jgi:hypothetical protein
MPTPRGKNAKADQSAKHSKELGSRKAPTILTKAEMRLMEKMNPRLSASSTETEKKKTKADIRAEKAAATAV